MRKQPKIKIVIERHKDGYVGYPIGMKGVVIGQGGSYDDALEDTRSAIRFHIESFGKDAFETDQPVLEAFIAEAEVS